ncbi:NADH dehydrogenase [ubiquinone] 1 alpha subcomplex subunit 12-like [Xenia sp. Carnegie-2017]|uniref:NADH dehydrogenase [ubiquinone] 1 alpha subcomplex subunit 12-like n=1 Tax=Xenia sp. Carnegie-2017 TaxID=2897299 RepID=UPI001F03A16B|nr:NADH dehydrogenase [ubiquinone] 1 alpha subcomplex subunit 12-like [Xenia sp. Carnegie-2017]
MAGFLKVFKDWINFQKDVYNSLGKFEIFRRLLREGNVRVGTLVGADKYGNEYFENNSYFMGRNRFVKFPYKDHRLSFDASEIPPEWHRWMHYMTDDPPNKVVPEQRKWMADHTVNLSGTNKRYVPYSTTRPKIEAWSPPKLK